MVSIKTDSLGMFKEFLPITTYLVGHFIFSGQIDGSVVSWPAKEEFRSVSWSSGFSSGSKRETESKELADWFKHKLGIGTTYSVFERIPEDCTGMFLRGMVDAGGSIAWSSRQKKQVYITIGSDSETLLRRLSDFLEERLFVQTKVTPPGREFRLRVTSQSGLSHVLRSMYPSGKEIVPKLAVKNKFLRATLDTRFDVDWSLNSVGPFGGILEYCDPKKVEQDFIASGENLYVLASFYNDKYKLRVTYSNLRDLLYLKTGKKLTDIKLEQDLMSQPEET